jgi:dTDP-4-dehydrorhamnose reductase
VNDQFGAPTSSSSIAEATTLALQSQGEGLFHMTAAGKTTWFGFTQAILRIAAISTPVAPIPSAQYPAKATRPRNSVLDNSRLQDELGIRLPDWESQLEQVMAQVSA